jgi:hypothetical protein
LIRRLNDFANSTVGYIELWGLHDTVIWGLNILIVRIVGFIVLWVLHAPEIGGFYIFISII